MKISLLIPTRNRNKDILRLIEELRPVSNIVEVIVGIDMDDNSYSIEEIEKNDFIKIVRTPKTKYLSNLYNILFEYSSNEIIGYFSDDITFLTLKKFQEVIDYYHTKNKNELYYFSPCDYPYPQCVPDHAFVTRKSILELGFMFPSGLEHGYLDHFMGRLYKETKNYFLDTSDFIKHLRHDRSAEEYFEKSYKKDENGMTCDDRDLITFERHCDRYLKLYKDIINESNQD